jgi:arginyl-tRNA synthetase
MTTVLSPLIDILAQATELPVSETANLLTEPPNSDMGDYAFPCFPLAKAWRRSPVQVAAEIAGRLTPDEVIQSAASAGPYVNIHLRRAPFAKTVLAQIHEQGERFGSSEIGRGKRVVIDFSSPNMAKPFHVGHLSSTIIGGSLSRIFAYQGYEVVRINHLGDWGTPVGQQIAAFRRWGDSEALQAHPIAHMVELYQRFHREKAENSALEEEARDWFRRLENGDKEARSFWEQIREVSIAELERAYARLNVEFDGYIGEAFYEGMLKNTVEKVIQAGISAVSEGALIVPLDDVGIGTPLILRKSDGATIYATRDIAAALYRAQEYRFDQCLYVVAHDQELHFRQLFATLARMGNEWATRCVHVQFGHVHGMSTRKGGAILLDELLDRATGKVRETVEENAALFSDVPESEIDAVCEAVGVGAVIHGTLNHRRTKDVEFSWENALTFNGETGPYIQYAHARLCSILRKAEGIHGDIDETLLAHDAEWALVKELAGFPQHVANACTQYEPSQIARYAVDLAQAFTRFYDQCRVLSDDKELTHARLTLVEATRTILASALGLVCMKAPERM